MMFKPVTESLGEELLMLYQGDFHAKTYPQQEGGGKRGRAIRNVERNGEKH
jgi:hypothetical protein